MGKRQLFAATLAAAAVTVAGVAASGTPAHAKMQVEKPFSYVSEGTVSNEPIPQCDLSFPGGEPVLLCDQEFAGTDERATHLGRTTSTATGVLTVFVARPPCTTPEGNVAGTQYESNTDRTIVAANGDALFVSTTVTGCSDGVALTEPEGTYTVTGGTGRFAGATGEGNVSSSVLGGSIDTTWTGTVTY
jgi:hypothetical protein